MQNIEGFNYIDGYYVCRICGEKYHTPYYHGGAIEHSNMLSTIDNTINRFDFNRDRYRDGFLSLIVWTANEKTHPFRVGMKVSY